MKRRLTGSFLKSALMMFVEKFFVFLRNVVEKFFSSCDAETESVPEKYQLEFFCKKISEVSAQSEE